MAWRIKTAITNYCECDNTHKDNGTVCHYCWEKYTGYLNKLRDSSKCNMFEAGRYMQIRFGLDKHTAKSILLNWMENER